MSDIVLSLDMSQDNKSWIRFTFNDQASGTMMSSTIDKFFKSDFNLIQDLSDAESDA